MRHSPDLLHHGSLRQRLRANGWIFFAALLALVGMLVAWAAVTTGQDVRRQRETLQLNYDRVYWENELAIAIRDGHPADEIAHDRKIVAEKQNARVISYARYGRQFTSWDGYRYEEIVDQGYIFHQPDATAAEKDDSLIDVHGPERRTKNVVWYPLYPLLATGLMYVVPGLSSTNALTAISWITCLLGAVVLFAFARRYFAARGAERADTAAMWVLLLLLFGPCSVFLYANFTESLFVLLLATFLFCLHRRWWWRAALVAAFASSCRSQGVLFGPILALTYLVRNWQAAAVGGGALRRWLPFWKPAAARSSADSTLEYRGVPPTLGFDAKTWAKHLAIAAALGFVSAIGLMLYMIFLYQRFNDPLAFMHAQRYWNVGIGKDQILYALNPNNAIQHVRFFIERPGPIDWPRLWEALCLIWPPIVLLIWGWRYLSLELHVMGWILWGLPYVSNSLAGNPPKDTQWMSMGRFMAVSLPIYFIAAALFEKRRRLGVVILVPWIVMFGAFCMKYGDGAWVG